MTRSSCTPREWYAEHDVELLLGTPGHRMDLAAKEVTLADGSRCGYAKLLLATGSSPAPLTVPGADLGRVLYLRGAGDSERLKAAFTAVPDRGDRRRLDRPGDRRRRPHRRSGGHRTRGTRSCP